jgi:putative flippase GtrA
MTTEIADEQRRVRMSRPDAAGAVRELIGRFFPRAVQRQLIRFAVIGAASTVAYGLLFLALGLVVAAFVANVVALLLTAIVNTAANRRLAFGVRGGSRLAGDHTAGLLAFGAGLALTTGSLAVLHAMGSQRRGIELLVLTAANAVATLLRFMILKLRMGQQSVHVLHR